MPPSVLLQKLRMRPPARETLALLNELSCELLSVNQLQEYHEHLLFYKAFSPSKAIRKLCEEELAGFIARVEALDEYSFAGLDLSGIVGTKMTYAYEMSLAEWLMSKVGRRLDVDWEIYEEMGADKLEDLLSVIVELSETDAIDSQDISVREFIDAARGRRTALQWLIRRMKDVYSPPTLWPTWDALLLDLSMQLDPPAPSRTLNEDTPPSSIFLWNPQAKKQQINLVREVQKPLDIRPPVSKKRGQNYLDLVHSSLLVRLREYYGATRANPEEFYDIPVGRGMRLLLFFMHPEHRLPLEAGLGFLLVKNGVPIGYGGGGIHAKRIEIAINIFDTWRGTDAGWIYAQTARVCYAFGHSPWLIARKYQLGHENLEGLKSGSFWFYYKLGFRSINPDIRELAEAERQKIKKQKGYRTSVSTLRKLAAEDAVLSLRDADASEYIEPPQDRIGLRVTDLITERYSNHRDKLRSPVLRDLKKLIGADYTGWSKSERDRFAQFGLFIPTIPGIENWPRRDLDKLIRLGRLKGSPREGDYIKAFRHNHRFFDTLERLALAEN